MVARQLTWDTNLSIRDKACINQAKEKEFSDPFRILLVVFVAFHRFDSLGIGNDNAEAELLKDVEYRCPVFAGRLHTHIQTIVRKKPIGKTVEIGIKRWKPTPLVTRL